MLTKGVIGIIVAADSDINHTFLCCEKQNAFCEGA